MKKSLVLILCVLLIGGAVFSASPALATKLPEAASPGYVSEAAVEAFASRAQNATTESVAIYGSDTCGKFINWCFNAIPELVNARGGQESGTACVSLVQALLWKKLGNFYWLCTGTVTKPIDSSLWDRWVGELGPASQFKRVSSFTPKRGDIVVFSSGSSATVLSHAGVMTSQTKWKHSSSGTVYPNASAPWEGFNVKASYNNSKYNWSEYIVGFFRFNTSATPADTTAPTVTSASLFEASTQGYWIEVEATDNTELDYMMVGSWNDVIGIDNARWQKELLYGTSIDKLSYIDIVNDFGGTVNTWYHSNVYVYDTSGNQSGAYRAADVYIDTVPPAVSAARVANVTEDGYDVYCTVTDSGTVDTVRFLTWNSNMSSANAYVQEVHPSGSGQVSVHISLSNFGSARNVTYHTDVIAYDAFGNASNACRAGDPYIAEAIQYGTLQLEALVNGSARSSIPGQANVYINGTLVSSTGSGYSGAYQYGTAYRIELAETAAGYSFDGVTGAPLSGVISDKTHRVRLCFSTGDQWVECDALPSGVTAQTHEIQYDNFYQTAATSSPGSGWVQGGLVSADYVKSGGTYFSDIELSTSLERRLVSYYYYHFCGASHGVYADHVERNGYVHYDSILDVNSVTEVSSQPDDTDAGYVAYILDWKTGGRAYCKSGVTCDGSYGTHGNRAYYWYKMSCYQDYRLQYTYQWNKESGWVSTRDAGAVSVKMRYRRKTVPVQSVSLTLEYLEASAGDVLFSLQASVLPANAYPVDIQWSVSDPSVAEVDGGSIRLIGPGAAAVTCTVNGDPALTAVCRVVSHGTKRLVLPAGTRVIAANAFRGDTSIEEVVLPEGLERIETGAFFGCTGIRLITAPDSLQEIAYNAFARCSGATVLCSAGSAMAQYCENSGYFQGWIDPAE